MEVWRQTSQSFKAPQTLSLKDGAIVEALLLIVLSGNKIFDGHTNVRTVPAAHCKKDLHSRIVIPQGIGSNRKSDHNAEISNPLSSECPSLSALFAQKWREDAGAWAVFLRLVKRAGWSVEALGKLLSQWAACRCGPWWRGPAGQ